MPQPAFTAARALTDRQPPEPLQAALTNFIAEGHLGLHLRRMRLAYRARREALLQALDRECAQTLEWPWYVEAAGLHIAVTLRDQGRNDTEVSAAATQLGV